MNLKYYKELAYEEIGENKENIILFLHSKIVSNWIWTKQKEEYDKYFKNYHCIFIDLPHHGYSQIEGEFSIEESSLMIIDFLKDLLMNKERTNKKSTLKSSNKNKENHNEKSIRNSVNIVALGIGGSIAIEILNKKPQLVNHLILSGVEIANEKEDKENSIINCLAKTKADYLNEKPDRFIVSAYLRYFGIKKDYYEYMERNLDLRIKKEKEISFESFNYTIPNLSPIKNKKEILLIYGNKEDLTCTYSAIKLKNIFKNARLIEIQKGNHLWNLINPKLFNLTIVSFIEKEEIINDERIKIIN